MVCLIDRPSSWRLGVLLGFILLMMLPWVRLPAKSAAPAESRTVVAAKGMAVSVSPTGTQVGVEILRKGGNAVDAAIAMAFAMAVTYPAAGNIGGGGFMLIYPGNGRDPVVIDYRETAPQLATREMFVKDDNPYSHRVSGTPGTVRGMELAHKRFGKLPWKELVMPAVRLAEEGFTLNEALAKSLNAVVAEGNAEFKRYFGKNHGIEPWQAGDRWVQKDLGKSLRSIAENGAEAFYNGPIADLLEAEMKRGGGLIRKNDLAAYQAKERKPIVGTYRGYTIYAPPPPSAGGICLVEMLNILENFDLKQYGPNSAETIHLFAETMKRAYCDRARYLGDADFVEIPAFLTSKEYAKKQAATISRTQATPSEKLAPELKIASEGESTTHFSVVDGNGMAVANTYTLEHSYGSRVVVRGAGFLLNNEMLDFNRKPGVTDRKGNIGTEANTIAPGKRMLSSQTPTIVTKDGKLVLVTGSPGGRTITNTVLRVVTNVIDHGMDIQSAVDAPRIHHQWFPDELRFEAASLEKQTTQHLRALGHKVFAARQGDAHSIWVDPKTGNYHGVADQRIDGKAEGF